MSEINPRFFRNMFLGGINHMFFRWLIVGKVKDTDKISEIEEVTDLLTASVSKQIRHVFFFLWNREMTKGAGEF
jgi:hypothetical protein